MKRGSCLVLAILAVISGIVSGCGYEGGLSQPVWRIPRAEVPVCLQDVVEGRTDDLTFCCPLYVLRYQYDTNTYYYVRSDCPDFMNWVIDEQCNIFCAPDGGRSGFGDGSCVGFHDLATNKQVVWCDSEETCVCVDDPFQCF